MFPRNEAVEVCTDTADKLSHPPYAGLFSVIATASVSEAGSNLVLPGEIASPAKDRWRTRNDDVTKSECGPGCC